MTIDEAIKHAEEVAEEQDKLCKRYDDASGYSRSHNETIRTTDAKKCEECAEQHRQLAEWLKELKQLRGQFCGLMDVLELIKQIKPEQKWININTQLPTDNKEYFVKLRNGCVIISRFDVYSGKFMGFQSYSDQILMIPKVSNYTIASKEVISWMPIPE